MAGAAVAGATVLGVGSWWESKPRALIYASAANAVTCAIKLVEPQKLAEDTEKELPKNIDDLNKRIPKLSSAINREEQIADESKRNKILPDAKISLSNALSLLNKANVALSQSKRSQDLLINAVDSIIAATDKQLITTIPDPQALSTGMGGLVFQPQAPSAMTKPQEAGATTRGPTAESVAPASLEAAKESVDETNGKISTNLTSTQQPPSDAELNACFIDVTNVVKPFVITPNPGTTIKFKKAESNTFAADISGGKQPYTARLLNTVSKGTLEAEIVVTGNKFALRIRSDNKLEANPSGYTVIVSDSTDTNKVAIVVIVE